jgi:uncharacterized protein YdhG (YjbR/CyaY superfamily)
MINAVDTYFLNLQEPDKSCMLFLRTWILKQHPQITESLKYGMPFYSFNKKMFCYLWKSKTHPFPYIGFVNGNLLHHEDLIQEKRARIKILLLNPNKDIPIKKLKSIFSEAIKLMS